MSDIASEPLALIAAGAKFAAPADTPAKALHASVFRELATDFNPIGFSQTALVRELARRGAQLVSDQNLYEALENHVGPALGTLVLGAADDEGLARKFQAGLGAHERLEGFSRRSRQNTEAFVRLLRQVTEIQRNRTDAGIELQRDARFTTEAQCLTYLVRRFRTGQQLCRQCNQTSPGSWIATRRCWQCASCKTQTCVRHGTVFARSGLPLVKWFHAVQIALFFPHAGAPEVAVAIGIRRRPTVRTMLKKIRAVMAADDATALLVGLDQVYLPGY